MAFMVIFKFSCLDFGLFDLEVANLGFVFGGILANFPYSFRQGVFCIDQQLTCFDSLRRFCYFFVRGVLSKTRCSKNLLIHVVDPCFCKFWHWLDSERVPTHDSLTNSRINL
jgi:hypothetical protein